MPESKEVRNGRGEIIGDRREVTEATVIRGVVTHRARGHQRGNGPECKSAKAGTWKPKAHLADVPENPYYPHFSFDLLETA